MHVQLKMKSSTTFDLRQELMSGLRLSSLGCLRRDERRLKAERDLRIKFTLWSHEKGGIIIITDKLN